MNWILGCYKEKKPRDPTIAEKFNTYRFADYKEQVIDLLRRVGTVSVETMKRLSGRCRNRCHCESDRAKQSLAKWIRYQGNISRLNGDCFSRFVLSQ